MSPPSVVLTLIGAFDSAARHAGEIQPALRRCCRTWSAGCTRSRAESLAPPGGPAVSGLSPACPLACSHGGGHGGTTSFRMLYYGTLAANAIARREPGPTGRACRVRAFASVPVLPRKRRLTPRTPYKERKILPGWILENDGPDSPYYWKRPPLHTQEKSSPRNPKIKKTTPADLPFPRAALIQLHPLEFLAVGLGLYLGQLRPLTSCSLTSCSCSAL